jgi:nucleoside-diphosphate-sugar epimerase
MHVLVTGGTGFIGSHTVEALLRAGHTVRLLARDRGKVERVLGVRGVSVENVVLGDMTNAETVHDALRDCEAVVHAAAAVEIERLTDSSAQNMAGSRNVIGCAVEMGLDPIIVLSSVATMFPPRGPIITVDDPIANLDTAYGRSKAESERYARELQAREAPIVSVYPSGVYGPDDPGLGPSLKGLRDRIRFGWLKTTGGVGIVDVRDVASIIVAALEPGRGPRRYLAGGHFLPWMEEADLCEELTGRKVARYPGPPALVRAAGRTVDFIKRVFPSFDYPLTHEASIFVTRFVPCDSSKTVQELDVEFRPARETHYDSIVWMLRAGMLDPKYAPRIAS